MSPTQRTHYILDLKSIQESLDTKFDVALARAEQFTQIRNALLEPFQFRGELDSLHYLEFASVEEAEN
jgi:hypothetical protein